MFAAFNMILFLFFQKLQFQIRWTLGVVLLNIFQMIIGFISNLIVFPPILLIVYLFKKSKPLKKRANRLDRGLEQGKTCFLYEGLRKILQVR